MHPVVSWKFRLALVCIICAIGACKIAETAVPLEATLGGHVEFFLSGGLSGHRQSLTIDDTGLVTVRDDKHRKMARGQLDPARLAELRAAFIKVNENPATTTQRLGARCADCYHYTLKATIGGRRHHLDVSSVMLQTSSYGEIVRFLSQLSSETLSRPAMATE